MVRSWRLATVIDGVNVRSYSLVWRIEFVWYGSKEIEALLATYRLLLEWERSVERKNSV